MKILRYFLRNITILNIILICCIILISYVTVFPLFATEIKITLPTSKKIETEDIVSTHKASPPTLSDYISIADKNLFHPERRIPEKKEEKQLPKPEFVLYGTLITDTTSIAYMEDMKAPYNTSGRGKRQKAIPKGSTFSGFVLSEVYHDKVVMIRGEERIEINILDQQHKKTRGTETTAVTASGQTPVPPVSEIKDVPEQPRRSRAQVTTTPATRNQR